jgi:hypothetical protein
MQRVQRQDEDDDDAIAIANDDDDDDDDDDDNEAADDVITGVSESEIIYSIDAFGAIAVPVTITMVLSALAVVFINTEETIAAGEKAFANTYQIFDLGGESSGNDNNEEDGSTSMWKNLGLSVVNTLVIVTVICFMTFIVVLCYKYKCMKIFYGYMVLVTASLLGYFTSSMILVAISIYPWMNPDKLSFAFLIYNYAAVGTIAIFLPRGIPQWITQGYLIAGSVCLAWQLSYFNSWMAWTLLVMLALYDLFAVLTPCGPLKYLAKMISEEGAPALPGLLYEANLSNGVAKPDRNKAKKDEAQRRRAQRQRRSTSEEPEAAEEEKQPEREDDNYHNNDDDDDNDDNGNNNYVSNDSVEEVSPRRQATGIPTPITKTTDLHTTSLIPDSGLQGRQQQIQQFEEHDGFQQARGVIISSQQAQEDLVDMSNTGNVPLVLAKLYKLDVLDTNGILSSNDDNNRPRNQSHYTAEEIRNGSWTNIQLRTEIKVIFPSGRSGRSGTISKAPEQKYDVGVAYIVYDRLGNEEHKFVVTTQGTVMQVLRRESAEDENESENNDDNTIKLGLGDFIFYSVLVSKAAQYSFTTFAACLLVVLTGLAATLVILAIKGKALPALPISIFLGVVTFLLTKTFVQPWIYSMLMSSFYV